MSGYRLLFRKRSADGSAKCDAECTGKPEDELRIAVFDIPESGDTYPIVSLADFSIRHVML